MASPRKTRSSQTPSQESVPDEVVMATTSQLPIVKVVLGPKNGDKLHTIRLPHPKNGCPSIFLVDNPSSPRVLHELLSVGDSLTAWLISPTTVEHDGRLLTANRIHLTFVLLPFVRRCSDTFKELDDIVDGDGGLMVIAESPVVDEWMEKIADVKLIDETTTVYRYNEETTMAFLKNKFDTLAVLLKSPTAKQNINVSILDNEEVYRRYVFGILSDYMDTATTTLMREHLGIVNVTVPMDLPPVKKSKTATEPTENYGTENMPLNEKPKVITKKQADLKKASKGTAALTSFFKKK